jgi:hypothetical protein
LCRRRGRSYRSVVEGDGKARKAGVAEEGERASIAGKIARVAVGVYGIETGG